MNIYAQYIILLVIFVIFGFILLRESTGILNEIVDFLFRKQLRKGIVSALKGNHDSKNDIDILTKSLGFQDKNAHKECLKIQAMIIQGKFKNLESKKDHLGKIIDEYESTRPFEDLPSDIRSNLIGIKKNYNGDVQDIERLNYNIQSIINQNATEFKKQKMVGNLSLFLGIVSILLAIYAQFSK